MQVLTLLLVGLVGVVICLTETQAAVITASNSKDVDTTNNDTDISGRIFNGQAANIRDYPWMVGVYGMQGNGYVTCGGALISRNLVLTAEHCVDMPKLTYKITLGSSLPFDNVDGDGKTIRYADLSIKYGDGAILRLSESVSFSQTIRPVRLPAANDYVGAGVRVYTSGFGGNGNGLSPRLMYTWFDTITNQKCAEMYGISAWKDDVLCARNTFSIICGGDSGSPVVRYDNGVATHVGIVNARAATPCNDIALPALITRTNKYVDWINSEIKRHSP